MADRQSTHKTIMVLNQTFDIIQAIRQHMEANKGVPVSGPFAMREIVNSYVEAHPELKGKG